MADISKITTLDGTTYNLKDAAVPAWAKADTKPTYTAQEVGAIPTTQKGVAGGVAELDSNGRVPSSQLPPGNGEVIGVKGDAESSYRTGQVNLTAANIGAVAKSGDTMTGNLYLEKAGETYVKVTNTSTGCAIYLDSSGSYHGLWSNGYWNGSSFVSSGKWIFYRNTFGDAIVDGKATNVTGTVAVDHGGTGATTAAGARANLDVPSTTGSGASGTWGIGISGNAATATQLASAGTTGQFYRGDRTWSDTLLGTLKITNSSNTMTIGSQNSSYTHIYSSANIPFVFNNSVLTTTGNLGNTTYPWNNLYIGKANGAGIYYQGTQANYRMIRFIDNTSDTYGNGISIGGGGATIIGGGESADAAAAQLTTGGNEILYLCNDGDVNIFPNMQDGWASRKTFTFNTSGNLVMPSGGRIGESGGALYLGNSSNANWVYVQDIASQNGADKWKIQVGGSATFAGTVNAGAFSGPLTGNVTGNCSGSSSSCTGNAATASLASKCSSANLSNIAFEWSGSYSTGSWMLIYNGETGTNGGALFKTINATNTAAWVDSAHKWARIGGDTFTGNVTTSGAGERYFRAINTNTSCGVYLDSDSPGNHGIWSTGYWNGSAYTASGKWMIYRNTNDVITVNGNCTGSSGSCTGNAATATRFGNNSNCLLSTNDPSNDQVLVIGFKALRNVGSVITQNDTLSFIVYDGTGSGSRKFKLYNSTTRKSVWQI